MPEPAYIAAIDAGSNAIRLLIARAEPDGRVVKLDRRRSAVRLGHNVFTRHEFDEDTIAHAVQTFSNYRHLMDKRRVAKYRAVATSATRNAYNRITLIERIRKKTGIELEVIDGIEEARLVREAVVKSLGPMLPPSLILDLGGGSLEISFLKNRHLEKSFSLAIGTVRLMEAYGISGPVSDLEANALMEYFQEVMAERVPRRPVEPGGYAVVCGGNGEALGQIAPGPQMNGVHTLDLKRLAEHLPTLLSMTVAKRRREFDVRRDRAEVMGIAALLLVRLGEWFSLRHVLIPGVGLREGLVNEIALTHFGADHHQVQALAGP